MGWIMAHWMEIGVIAALAIPLGERIARPTPTETDDKILQSIRKIAMGVGLDFPDNQGYGDIEEGVMVPKSRKKRAKRKAKRKRK